MSPCNSCRLRDALAERAVAEAITRIRVFWTAGADLQVLHSGRARAIGTCYTYWPKRQRAQKRPHDTYP